MLLRPCRWSQPGRGSSGAWVGKRAESRNGKTLAKNNFFEEVVNRARDGGARSRGFTGAHWRCHACRIHWWHCQLQRKQPLEAFFVKHLHVFPFNVIACGLRQRFEISAIEVTDKNKRIAPKNQFAKVWPGAARLLWGLCVPYSDKSTA